MEIVTLVMVVISTATTVLFGVWRIAAHYATRNEKAHGELRAAIDKANESNDKAHGELRGELREVAGDVKVLVGRQQERDLASQRTAD